MKLEKLSFRKNLYSGAIHGAVAWIIYGIVECLFSTILPWLTKPHYDYIPMHWGFAFLLLFVIYPLIGSILGGLLALVLSKAGGKVNFLRENHIEGLYQSAAVLTVVLVFSVNLIIQLPLDDLSVLLALLMAVIFTVAIIMSLLSNNNFKKLRFLTNPWVTSLSLIGLLWVSKELLRDHSVTFKAVVVPVYLFICFFVSSLIQKKINAKGFRESSDKKPAISISYFAFLMAASLILICTSLIMIQSPIRTKWSVKSSHKDRERPNVILISMDTVRADHLSLYGYERDTTPNLKKFAEEATLYTHAVSSGDMTLTSHASIFTGMYARQHGAHREPPDYVAGRPLDEKFHTLAEKLSENGYLTIGVVSNYSYLGKGFYLDQGFNYYDYRTQVPFIGRAHQYYLRQNIREAAKYYAPPSLYEETRSAEDINNEVFKLVDKVKKENAPFFLFVNYMDAHWPYIPPPPFDSLYPGKKGVFTLSHYLRLKKQVMNFERNITEEEQRHLISQYDGGIAYIDFQIRELCQRLKEAGLYQNSIIIITSDHGEAFGDRNLMEHGVSVYQDLVYVPLIIKYPYQKNNKVIDEPVSVTDIMPTVLEVLGYKIPEDVQGNSLLSNSRERSLSVVSESFFKEKGIRYNSRFDRIERAIYSGSLKYISSTTGKRELYDLLKDPKERENIYNSDSSISKDFENRLNQWLEMNVYKAGSTTELKQEVIDRLKTLGYIQ